MSQVVIDNTDSRVLYTGENWTTVGPFEDGYGVPVYGGSQAMTFFEGDQFSFNFRGSAITVMGAWDYTDQPLPECSVDGEVIGGGPSAEVIARRTQQMTSSFPDDVRVFTNQLPLCSAHGLLLGLEHRLTVKATGSARLAFDFLRYTPPESAVPDGEVLYVEDYGVEYTREWQTSQGTTSVAAELYHATMASEHGASFEMNFTGTRITMIGILDNLNTKGTLSIGIYRIDESDSTLDFPPVGAGPDTLFQQIVFQSGPLENKQHRLGVAWDSQPGTQRFGLTNFYIETSDTQASPLVGALPSSTVTPASTSIHSPSPTASASSPIDPSVSASGTKASVPAIAGGVVGGVVLLVSALLCLWFWRHRPKRSFTETVIQEEPFANAGPYTPGSYTPGPYTPGVNEDQGMQTEDPLRLSVWSGGGSSRPASSSVFSSSTTETPYSYMKAEQSRALYGANVTYGGGQFRDSDVPEVRLHEDSGIRMSFAAGATRPIDVPPVYAPI
ncbi:hypothetical protein BDZ89DRAFT_1164286 [Hymenopellis radicata]|nr:hypothetical protein BDZ89DRAFT_1164286 [Hymenopellis radicata]